jgi:ABC-type sugar transport system permease subunit
MSSTTTDSGTTTRGDKRVALLGLLVAVLGLIMVVAGGVTWFTVQSALADEKITVSEDADRFAGDAVDGPFTAYAEADIIEKHALEATGGKTYAELDREDPARETVMTGSFLRASLFTSVVSFGVAAMAVVLGLVLMVIGYALRRLARETLAA